MIPKFRSTFTTDEPLFLDTVSATPRRERRVSKAPIMTQSAASNKITPSTMDIQYGSIVESSSKLASEKAANMLDSVQSLERVSELKDSVQRQQNLIKNQVTSLVSQQINEARKAMSLLSISGDALDDSMKDYFTTIARIGQQNLEIIENYALIREVLKTMENVKKARDTLKGLIDLEKEVQKIADLLNESDDNILEAHERICNLEDIRDAALEDIYSGNDYVDKNIFKNYFSKIDKISDSFESLIWSKIDDVETLAEGKPTLVVSIFLVIEREEKRDKLKQELLKEKEQIAAHQVKKKKDNKEIPPKMRIKNYKQRCIDVIKSEIKEKFDIELKKQKSLEEKLSVLTDIMEIYLSESIRVCEPVFPDDYDIRSMLIEQYEHNLTLVVNKLMDLVSKSGSSQKLALYKWLDDYPLLVDRFVLEPLEFEEEKRQILDDFFSSRAASVNEFCMNAISQSLELNKDGEMKIVNNSRNFPYSPYSSDIFSLLNSQLDDVYQYKAGEALTQIVVVAKSTIKQYQIELLNAVEKKIEEISEENLCALCNTASQCIEFLGIFEEKLISIYIVGGEEDSQQMNFKQIYDGFHKLGEDLVSFLAQKMIVIMDKAFQVLFHDAWYGKNVKSVLDKEIEPSIQIKAVTDTITDYFDDFSSFLEPMWLEVLTELMTAKIVLRYLDALIISTHPIFKPTTVSIIQADIGKLEETLKPFIHSDTLKVAFRPIKALIKVMTVLKVEDCVYEIGDLLEKYHDLSFNVLEVIINYRVDLNKNEKSLLMNEIKSVFEEHEKHQETKKGKQPTIFAYYQKFKEKKGRLMAMDRSASRSVLQFMKTQTSGIEDEEEINEKTDEKPVDANNIIDDNDLGIDSDEDSGY